MVKTKTIGPVSIYGDWDATDGRQFAVIWHESGDHCTVLIMAGADYGGGISMASSRVPMEKAAEICLEEDDYERYTKMVDLINPIDELS